MKFIINRNYFILPTFSIETNNADTALKWLKLYITANANENIEIEINVTPQPKEVLQ